MHIQDAIILQLQHGDRYAIELKSSLRVSGADFWGAINVLKAAGRIIPYFRSTPPSATLCFTLPQNQSKDMVTRWNRSEEQGIKPWQPTQPLLSPYV